MGVHLDWHFRINRREKLKLRTAFSRHWYLPFEEWMDYEGHESQQSSGERKLFSFFFLFLCDY